MAYTKHTWIPQELITSDKLNNMESGIDDANKGIYFKEPEDKVNLDDPHVKKYQGYRTIVLSGSEEVFTQFMRVNAGDTVSISLNRAHVTYDAPTGGGTWGVQYYSDTSYVGSVYSLRSKASDFFLDKLEGLIVPQNATKMRLRFFPDGGIMKINQIMVNLGTTAKSFDTGELNLLVNNTFEDGLAGFFSDTKLTVPLNNTLNFIDTEDTNDFYKIDNDKTLIGTLPDGVLSSNLTGAVVQIIGSSKNGLGGTTIILFTNDKVYQKKYTYQWSDWHVVQGVFGSFDEAGAWHSLSGNIVEGGIIYNPKDDSFYALATNGTPYNLVGWQTLPIGKNRTDLTVKLTNGGKIDPDITSSSVVDDYIKKVNEYIEKSSDRTSIHMVVTDTHGVDYNDLARSRNYLLSGNQYKTSWNNNIYPIVLYVTKKDYDTLSGKYFRSIARLNAKNTPANMVKIAGKFVKTADVYSHLGDIEDGHNGTAQEERQAYDVVATPYRQSGFNIIDGNHDEQPYPYEQQPITNNSGDAIITPIPGYVRTRRIDTQRWQESYGKESSYYSVTDEAHKIKYIYLDTFEGGKLKLKNGTSPDYGEYRKGGKLTSAQLSWLVHELTNIADDFVVVVNMHHLPYSNLFGKEPTDDVGDWWIGNVNPDLLAGILKAFQRSDAYKGNSLFTSDMDKYDMSPYQSSINVDFTGKQKNRIAVINYGHYHSYGHISKEDNGYFNIVQHPNSLDPSWSYIGDVRGQQFSTQLINVEDRTVSVIRFAPTSDQDPDFTLNF